MTLLKDYSLFLLTKMVANGAVARRHLNIDFLLAISLALLALCSAIILLLIFSFLVIEAWPVMDLSHGFAFLHDEGWYPLENLFGMTPMILGSMVITLLTMMLAVPLGLASAIFMCFYAPRPIAKSFKLMLNLLAGIPSVVFGLWGLTELVPLFAQWRPPGSSLLTASLVLALMILPTVALTSYTALTAVPIDIMAGASALGMSRKGQVLSVALPAARTGIIGGSLLATARALGETMAVLMVAGNVVQIPTSLFDPIRTLTANIALEMAYATGEHRASLFATGLLLTLTVMVLAWLANRTIQAPSTRKR